MTLALPRLLIVALVCCGLGGCGYHLVHSTSIGPVAKLRLAEVDTSGVGGPLAVRARSRLRREINQKGAPALVTNSQTELRTLVSMPSGTVVGFGQDGLGSVHQSSVQVELQVTRAGRLVWTSGPVVGTQPFVVGASPYETVSAKRRSIENALDAAVDAALIKFFHAPPLLEARS